MVAWLHACLSSQVSRASQNPEERTAQKALQAILYALELPLEERPTPAQAWCMLASAVFIGDVFESLNEPCRSEWLSLNRRRIMCKRVNVVRDAF